MQAIQVAGRPLTYFHKHNASNCFNSHWISMIALPFAFPKQNRRLPLKLPYEWGIYSFHSFKRFQSKLRLRSDIPNWDTSLRREGTGSWEGKWPPAGPTHRLWLAEAADKLRVMGLSKSVPAQSSCAQNRLEYCPEHMGRGITHHTIRVKPKNGSHFLWFCKWFPQTLFDRITVKSR